MKREKMKVVFAGWLVLVLSLGLNPSIYAADEHGAGVDQIAAGQRPVSDKPEKIAKPFDDFILKIQNEKRKKVKVIKAKEDKKEKVDIQDTKDKIVAAVRGLRDYRLLFPKKCKDQKDSALEFIDSTLNKLMESLNQGLGKKGISEKSLVSFVNELEIFLKEKKKKHPDLAKSFEKEDANFLKAAKKLVGRF